VAWAPGANRGKPYVTTASAPPGALWRVGLVEAGNIGILVLEAKLLRRLTADELELRAQRCPISA
jgi:hypothetical protein